MSSGAVMTEPVVPENLEALFRRRTQDLQMLPAIAIQALEIAKDPDCAITEFTAVVERDVKLAADILGMANSALYSPGRPIVNLHQSVVRLGFRQCKNLILSTSMTSLMKKITLGEEWIREVLWRHGFLTAMLAINVNRCVGAGFQGEEFAAGLIHDFGRTLFAVCLPDQFTKIDPLEFVEGPSLLPDELEACGTNHCEVGAWFAQINRLPTELQEVIRFHHDPTLALRHRRLVALTAVCDHMANHLQRGEDVHTYDLRENSALFILEGCGVRNAAGRLVDTVGEVMETAAKDAVDMMAF
jgi:HD-like signal output (HDOD) protein